MFSCLNCNELSRLSPLLPRRQPVLFQRNGCSIFVLLNVLSERNDAKGEETEKQEKTKNNEEDIISAAGLRTILQDLQATLVSGYSDKALQGNRAGSEPSLQMGLGLEKQNVQKNK